MLAGLCLIEDVQLFYLCIYLDFLIGYHSQLLFV